MNSHPQRLLVVRNDRLGDAILALPAVNLLRQTYPDSEIYFWAAPLVAPLIRCVEGVNGVIAGNDRNSDAVTVINPHHFDAAYCLRPTYTNALALKKAGIPIRVGTSRRWYSFLFNRRFNISRRGRNQHEADLNLALLSAAGVSGPADVPKIIIPHSAWQSAANTLQKAGLARDTLYVIIHPGSGGSAREWAPQYFRILAGELARQTGVTVVITGHNSEFDKCEIVSGGRHSNLSGRTDLLTLTAIISGAKLLVANSTGPLHLAVALGVKALGLYPPVADCLPTRWGPYQHPDWAMMPDLPQCRRCRPGTVSACACMDALAPEQVLERALTIMTSGDG